jgi:hypothetical protein
MKKYFQGILGAALLLAAVSAAAQINETVAVKVPFSFVADGTTWPAADYRIRITQPVGLVTLTTPGRKQASFVTNTDQHPGALAGRTYVAFERFSDRWILKEVAYQGTEQRLITSSKDKGVENASATAERTVLLTASAGN